MKHHGLAAESPSGPRDVVLVDEEIRVCGERSTTSHRRRRIGIQRLGAKETKEQGFAGIRAPSPKPRSGAPPKPDAGNPPLGTPPTRIPYFLAMKEAAVPSAQRLLPYIMLFLGLQDQRRSPRHPAAPSSGPLTPAEPTPPGSASPSPAKPSPHRRSLLIGEACTSRTYIARLGMRTVKVVPLPGMLST